MRAAGAVRMAGVVAALVVLVALPSCDSATDPPFASGALSFEWVEQGGTAAATWSAAGSCGPAGFELGAETCAVGSQERTYWAALGVLRSVGDGSFGTATVAHPRVEGECQASSSATAQCGLEFVPVRGGGSADPPPRWLLSSGTVTVALVVEDGIERLTGTFEGTATDPAGVQPPLTITNGAFDVELVR